jgi:hypothetical protein
MNGHTKLDKLKFEDTRTELGIFSLQGKIMDRNKMEETFERMGKFRIPQQVSICTPVA